MGKNFVLKGNICYSRDLTHLETIPQGYLVCVDGKSAGAYTLLPEQYRELPLTDCGDKLLIPGLTDLHVHAPQFAFRSLGMDLELLDWLNTHTFPEEAKYINPSYAAAAYTQFVRELRQGPNTRACVFATIHLPATMGLMDALEESGLVTMVGKVNMDRNSPDSLRESNAAASAAATRQWLQDCAGKYRNTTPILTPRFIPSCTDQLMELLKEIQQEYKLPVQSHLSENQGEVAWVKELCPQSRCYGDAYAYFGLFGGDVPTIMAHCVWSGDEEIALLRDRGVFVAHSPQSNMNLSSGIAPVRQFLEEGVNVGLASDVAGGCHTSMFRAMADAIQVSKLRWRLVDDTRPALTLEEAFYLGTRGGGAFFGKVGSFEAGYEFDTLVLDDGTLAASTPLSISDRLTRLIYFSGEEHIVAKYVRGKSIL